MQRLNQDLCISRGSTVKHRQPGGYCQWAPQRQRWRSARHHQRGQPSSQESAAKPEDTGEGEWTIKNAMSEGTLI